jgi:sialidase-1
LKTSGDARIEQNLWTRGFLYGESAHTPNYAEHLLLPLDDNADTPTVLDATGHYSQTFLDPSGNPNTNQHTTSGVVGSALFFDGLDDRIEIGERWYDVARAGQDFTMAFWWKFLDANVANQYVLHQQPSPGVVFYGYGPSNFKMSFYRSDGSLATCQQAGVNDGNWRFYTITRRGATLKWYVNGALVATDSDARNAGPLASSSSTHATALGSSNGGIGNFAHGALDEFRLYKRALSKGEIATLYNAGSGTAADSNW